MNCEMVPRGQLTRGCPGISFHGFVNGKGMLGRTQYLMQLPLFGAKV
jgi:hypothetical protein